MTSRFLRKISRLNYRHVLTDAAIIAFSFYFSLFLRASGTAYFETFLRTITNLIPIYLVIRIATFATLGIYDIIWRYISFQDVSKIMRAIAISTAFIVSTTYFVDVGLPRSIFFIDAVVATFLLIGIRSARRYLYETSQTRGREKEGRRVLIFGAGNNGRLLASRLSTDLLTGYQVVGFLDDDPGKLQRKIGGVLVRGTLEDIESVITTYKVQEVIVAISNAPSELLRKIYQLTHPHGIKPRLITGLLGHKSDGPTVELYRSIELSDLLSREPKKLDVTVTREFVRGKKVLITGAGGSIGSELARQVFSFGPSQLVLLDHSEFNLYQIDQELRANQNESEHVVPVLCDIKDRTTLKETLLKHMPELVFHAAAYKHVHLVEANPHASILNNIEGTKNLVDLCQDIGVRHFVQISTDKAVNPAGIMGATKRACELLVTDAGLKTEQHYCSVRFGNVLGSSGSLIPLLQKQIRNGEPITITHKDMTRYFMLIPEAVSLVLTAACHTTSGDIAILKMGEPIKILDIAKSLIALMGKQESDVSIVYTGLRPGEKMFEELCLTGKERPSAHPDIMILPGGDVTEWRNHASISEQIESIINRAKEHHKEALYELQALLRSDKGDAGRTSQDRTGSVLTLAQFDS